MNALYLTPKTTRADVECLILARLGFCYDAIRDRTGLTVSQISYRLRIAKISPGQYRRGETHLAQRVLHAAREDSAGYFETLVSTIRKHLKEGDAA